MIYRNFLRNTPPVSRRLCFLGMATAAILLSVGAAAQSFTVLKSLNSNLTGGSPQGPLVQGPDSTLYGTASTGGASQQGVVFRIQPDGTGFSRLRNFAGGNDGAAPYSGLVLAGNRLYGTTYAGGGASDYGTIFAVNTNGGASSILYRFSGGNDGGKPDAGLVLSGGVLYGTTTGEDARIVNYGTVFKIGTNGSGFVSLKVFNGGDGANPFGALVLSGSMLYGTTAWNTPGYGTVFAINTSGAGFTTLHSFDDGSDGGNPYAGLVLSGGSLYGVTQSGGLGNGTIFKVLTSGAGFSNPYLFVGNEGSDPYGGLVLAGGMLYGTTLNGGTGDGTIFEINPLGDKFTNLYNFSGSDGASPTAALIVSGSDLFGTTSIGGVNGVGTIFRFNPQAPSITSQPQPATQVVAAGVNITFDLSARGAPPLSYQWTFSGTNLPDATNVSLTLDNVTPAESGSYAVLLSNSLGTVLSSNALLTILPAIVTTLPVSDISATAAVLNGSISLGPVQTLAWFQWGTDTNYANTTPTTNIAGGSSQVIFSNALSQLDEALTYHYRIAASNSFGVAYGSDESFAVGLAPTAVTLSGTDAGPNRATLLGSVNAQGLDTTAYFEWGPFSSQLIYRTPAFAVGNGAAPLNVAASISNLVPGRVYFYQLVASNSVGTASGAIVSLFPGPWSLTSAPTHNWDSIASSADGTRLVAVGYDPGRGGPIYTSTNSGASWISNTAPLGPWESVACSADGTKLIVAGGGGDQVPGPIYLSTNSGATWAQTSAPTNNWASIAASADGTKLAAVDSIGQRIFLSTNTGMTWMQSSAPSNYWASVASSADGTKLVATAGAYSYLGHPPGPIYTSTNSGLSWISNSVSKAPWTHVSSSADGATLLAVGGGSVLGPIYTSTNSGSNWVLRSNPGARTWVYSAISADGTKMAAAAVSGAIFTSTNSGATWAVAFLPVLDWNAIASSADGNFLAASVGYPATGGIFTLQTTPTPSLNIISTANRALVSWAIPSRDFALQETDDLTVGEWTGVPFIPVLNLTNLHNQVEVAPSNASRFFRLQGQ